MTHSEYVHKVGEIVVSLLELTESRYRSREAELEAENARLRQRVADLEIDQHERLQRKAAAKEGQS